MSKFTRFSVILACLALVLVGLYLYTSRLTVEAELRVVPASYMPKDFQEASEAFFGKEEAEKLNIDDFSFVLLSAQAKCHSPFGAEWITLTLDPLPEDVCVHEASAGPVDLPAFGSIESENRLYITLLTRAQDAPRKARLEYYIRGRYLYADSAQEE